MTGVVLIGFQDIQHITGGTKLLLHGIDKTGQFRFNFFPPLLDNLIRPFLFFEKNSHRQKKDHRRQDRKNQQGRDHQQPDQPALDPGRRHIGFRGHLNFGGFKLGFQLAPFIGVQPNQRRRLCRHVEQDSVHAVLFRLSPVRDG